MKTRRGKREFKSPVGQLHMFDGDAPEPISSRRERPPNQDAWYEPTQALLIRHFACGEAISQICEDLDIRLSAGQSRIVEMRKIPIDCQCLKDFQSGARRQDRYPKRFQQNHSVEMAKQIARRLAFLAPKRRSLFEHAIRFYVEELTESQRIVLGSRDWKQHFAGGHCDRLIGVQNVVQMVKELKIEGVIVQYSSHRNDGKEPDLAQKLQAIGAPRGTNVTFLQPSNHGCKTNHEQMGIGIHNRIPGMGEPKYKASHAFRKVMALAFIRKIWLTPEQESQEFLSSSTSAD